MKLSTVSNIQVSSSLLQNRTLQNRTASSSTPQSLPYTYPEDMLRQKRPATPPDHLLKLIRKLAENNNKIKNNSNNSIQSFPPISKKKPEKTILKKYTSDSSNSDNDTSNSDNTDNKSLISKNSGANNLNSNKSSINSISKNSTVKNSTSKNSYLSPHINSTSESETESETICSDLDDTSGLSESSDFNSSSQHSPTRANSTPIKRRSVIFADTIGKPLERIRLISEKREDPPKFLLQKNRPSYFTAFSSGYNSTSDLSPTDDEEEAEEFFMKNLVKSGLKGVGLNSSSDSSSSNSIFGCRENRNDSRGERDVQSLIKLIEALKHKKDSSSRNCSYPIDASKILPVHNTNSIDSTYSARLTHSTFRKFNPCFAQPAINTALLMQRLSKYNVTLERSTITNKNSSTKSSVKLKFRGTVLCKNLDFTKSVKIHYSTNNWVDSKDCAARWRRSNLDGTHDVFEFDMDLEQFDYEIKSVQFCIRYNTSVDEFWDNNDGRNYVFQ